MADRGDSVGWASWDVKRRITASPVSARTVLVSLFFYDTPPNRSVRLSGGCLWSAAEPTEATGDAASNTKARPPSTLPSLCSDHWNRPTDCVPGQMPDGQYETH
jgi:hypothetical protein